MIDKTLKVLSVEDSKLDAELCWRELELSGLNFISKRVWSRETYEHALMEFAPDLILCDFSLPGAFDGISALTIMQSRSLDIPFIFVSGTIGEDRAVEAMKRGATDYVLKERLERLAPVVRRALQEKHERDTLRQTQQALSESEERFRQLAENIRDAFFLIDIHDQCMLYVSPAYEDIWGESCASLYENPSAWSSVIHPDDKSQIETIYEKRILGGQFDSEYRIVRNDGTTRWIMDRAFPVYDKSGCLQRVARVAADITPRKKAEERISRLNRLYSVLSDINSLIVRVSDRDELLEESCRILIESGRFCMAWVGLVDINNSIIKPVASAGVVHDFFDEMPLGLDDIRSDEGCLIREAIFTAKPSIENDIKYSPCPLVMLKKMNDRNINSMASVPLLIDSEVIGVLALYATDMGVFDADELRLLTELAGDISFALDYIAKGERLNYLAFYDVLTGLPNRALFTERLNQQLSNAEHNDTKVVLIMSDIKRFRMINESLGRQAGDVLLREIAERVRKNWPNTDSVAHISADCFAGTLVDLRDEAVAAHALEKTMRAITGPPYVIGDKELSISVTAGIAVFPADGGNTETLYKNAEAALKQAKASGERYLFYQPSMNARVADILVLENKLRKAIDKNHFVLYYQPKFSLLDGRLSGVEALIRWNDPDTGLVAPGYFIPLLEETGAILEVGAWAIQQALADRCRWYESGIAPPRVAVNVSAIQLRKSDFVDSVQYAIGKSGLPAHGLDLEVTESLIMENIDSTIIKLEALRDMNVNIAIDDFGTGYSSLSYLARLPVQLLKIDRSFINTMTQSQESMMIVSTIISLAHTLNLKVIAEGVETDEQSRLLQKMQCDEGQGYLFGRPMPFGELTSLLAKGR